VKRPSLSLAAVVAALVLAAGLAACGDDDDDGGGGGGGGGTETLDLTIGNSVPLTGDLADFGPPGEKAAEMAITEIENANQEAGVDNTVTLVTEDNETNPQAAVQVARKMVDADGASCIAGAWASADTVPTARSVSIREGVLQITPASTSTELTSVEDDGLLNRVPPADNLQGPALVEAISQAIGGVEGKTINIGARNDSYGVGFGDAVEEAWTREGGTVGERVEYEPTQPSYNSEAQQIVSGNPDAITIIDFPETFVKVGPALERTGNFDTSKVWITDGLASSTLVEENAELMEGIRGTAPGTPESGTSSQAFDQLFTESPPRDVERLTFDAQNFDAVILCYLAAVAAGSTDGQEMADALPDLTNEPGTGYSWEQLPQAIEALQNGEDINYLGASGEIELDENGDPTVGVYDTYEITDGSIEPYGKQIALPTIEAVTGG
jgi:ABC-type branched-subunit amino acid transport system substrate-binding protein